MQVRMIRPLLLHQKSKKKLTFHYSVSLDPDEDQRDATLFDGLRNFLANDMDKDECDHFKLVTLRNLARRAQNLRSHRPPRGLTFSLQQQRKLNLLKFIFCVGILIKQRLNLHFWSLLQPHIKAFLLSFFVSS